MATPQLVVVGAAARDVDPSDERGWTLGGGVSFSSLLAARLGVRVGVLIGLDPLARDARELTLMTDAGADLEVVPLANGPVFENIEGPRGRRQIARGLSDRLDPSALPRRWRDASTFLLAPVAGEIGVEWASALDTDATVALSWQGLLREMAVDEDVRPLPARPQPLFERAEVAGVSREDLRGGGAPLTELLPRPGQELAITAGERGALHVRRMESGLEMRRVRAVRAMSVRNPVGAGDSFLTAWVVARLRDGPFGPEPLSLGRALHFAALVATLGIERGGLTGVADAELVRARLLGGRGARVAAGATDADHVTGNDAGKVTPPLGAPSER
jgi:sugar/nucleoside kinase (ribokinase family)